jgi:hypothetical protein
MSIADRFSPQDGFRALSYVANWFRWHPPMLGIDSGTDQHILYQAMTRLP